MGWWKAKIAPESGRDGKICAGQKNGNRILNAVIVDRPGAISDLPKPLSRRGEFGGRYIYR
jgi:hypothetical protein